MPCEIRYDFSPLLGEHQSLAAFLARLITGSSENRRKDLESIFSSVCAEPTPQALFLVAILSGASDEYPRARRLVSVARRRGSERELPSTDPLWVDAALMNRLTLRAENLERANRSRKILLEQTSYKDLFVRARALAELAALELDWYSASGATDQSRIEDALTYMRDIRRDYPEYSANDSIGPWVTELKSQVSSNIICAHCLRVLAGVTIDREEVWDAYKSLRELRGSEPASSDFISQVWWLAGKWLTEESEQAANDLLIYSSTA